MKLLEVENLSLSFGKKDLLSNISFSVDENEFVGILGINGVGKTTLLKSILGLKKIKSGRVHFKGKAFDDWQKIELANFVTYLEQNKEVAWPLFAETVVELGLYPCQKKKASAVKDIMQLLECLHLAKRPIDELSGGERTLVLLARALVLNPDLLLMDEPISNLDPKHEINIMKILSQLSQNKKSVIAVLHSLPLAAQFCSRIILLHEGRIFRDGSPEEVLTQESIKTVYGIQTLIEKRSENFFISPIDVV